MRVLHVTPYFAPAFCYGGPPRSILGLCRGLRQAGVEVSVLTTSANGDTELSPEVTHAGFYAGIPVRYLPRSYPKLYFHARGLVNVLEADIHEYDLVHLHGCWNFLCWEAAHICRAEHVPYIVSPRGMLERWSFEHTRVKKWLAYHLVEKRNLTSAATIHVTSDEERCTVERLGLSRPIVVIPNGINYVEYTELPDRSCLRDRYGIRPEECVILYLGRVHPQKGLEVLGAAFELMLKERPCARLVVAGQSDPRYMVTLVQRFHHLLDSGHWIFTGQLEGKDRLAAFGASDIFALTSYSENFGLAVAEAMAAGLPVVLSRECPWPQVEQWQSGFWVQNDPVNIAEALLTLSADEELRHRLGENGRRGVFASLGWPRIAEKMRSAYEECLRVSTGSACSRRSGRSKGGQSNEPQFPSR